MAIETGSSAAIPETRPITHVTLDDVPDAVHKNYKGFVAGMFSGVAKLSGRYLRLI